MRTLGALAIAAIAVSAASALAAGPENPMDKAKPVVPVQARPFSHADVTITGGPFKHAEGLGLKYLLDTDPDRLLAPFYEAIGQRPRKPRYGGWEAQGISGHMLGHWLSGAARLSIITRDAELRRRLDYVVSELAALQARQPNGYVSGFPETPFLTVWTGEFRVAGFDLSGHWVPWYTMHKIFAGLLDSYEIAGNAQALEVVRKLGDWAIAGASRLNDQQFQRMLSCEHGGMAESMADLYRFTGEQKYLDLAKRFAHRQIFDPLAAGRDELTGRHANTQIPKIVGAARLYEFTGEDYYKNVAHTFWEQVATKRSYAFGGNSNSEHFPRLGLEPLGPQTAETCNTYNMLRLTRDMLSWKDDARYGDFYERALLNHILASQDPDSGMMTYFLSTKPGHFKVYSTPFDSMWCCTGSGMENPGRYAEAAYFHSEDALWINLYMPTELRWRARGLTLRQETTFPESPQTRVTITEAASGGETAIHFRVPYWAAGPVVARVNGTEAARAAAGSPAWLTVKRHWARGDVVEVSLPMNLHLHRAADNPNNVAILYGPVVLAARMGRENFPASDHYRDQNSPNNLPAPSAPVIVSDAADPASWLEAVPGQPLTFRTRNVARPGDFELMPFHKLHHERYTVYLSVLSGDQWAQREREMRERELAQRELERRTVDQINPGQQQPDIDHQMKGENTRAGTHNDRSWRDADAGGWFSYQIKVLPDAANILRLTFWGEESGNRTFDILVDGQKVGEQSLGNNRPGAFYDVDLRIPEDLTRGKSTVELKFQARPDNIAGGVFGIRVVRD